MKNKHLSFTKIQNTKTKTDRFMVSNEKNDLLGFIMFYPQWRQFIWRQIEDALMSYEYLQEVIDKLKELNLK
jgi:hypothetical protein